ncbi:hypothetical protein GbCGDNIH1_8040 [Granulibacter bethesdensis CGDNIH1]|uniref:Uncharacterized protein n=1 Tax=Granulibacter bethesdensis (strain ATCC BAA-1260 / CGDNIH1) TaxID=391165 RepID=A0A286M3A1_GRABC|nr:hypothetical protein GbCGDNIH5_8040 [Granulibacter bethesdensis]APH65860.1 hypothetical protein GbCGDNIH1I4_8040 [Granulibacter bethesdensis]ASV62500.1 hypothetical protein GbCGDNIH1_8040 [Granulibacter bethesdensis CGDNIH1]
MRPVSTRLAMILLVKIRPHFLDWHENPSIKKDGGSQAGLKP